MKREREREREREEREKRERERERERREKREERTLDNVHQERRPPKNVLDLKHPRNLHKQTKQQQTQEKEKCDYTCD
jgi:hypothetical protein